MQELNLVDLILVGPFQLRLFYDSMIHCHSTPQKSSLAFANIRFFEEGQWHQNPQDNNKKKQIKNVGEW